MTEKVNVFSIVRAKGHATTLRAENFWAAMDELHGEMISAGGNYNRPIKLFVNGKEIPLPDSITTFVYNHFNSMNASINELRKKKREESITEEMAELIGADGYGK